jgi:hypothetical protein
MALLAHSLTHSVATVRRKLLQMMDALAESGMRHAHREICRARDAARKPPMAADVKRKTRRKTSAAMH